MRKHLLVEVEGVVAAPVERVWRALRAARPEHVMTAEHTVAYQGGWWYRGEWSVEPDVEGTRVVHRVYNVAQRLRWGVPVANRFFIGFAARTRESFAAALARIGAELGAPTRVADRTR
ncbi:hypothetical protein [Nonomuraea maritima]|uniref:hypothetical protein n=1 Tax=Nonomuraea maritima TaxID=683260 RepID=UPI00371212A7